MSGALKVLDNSTIFSGLEKKKADTVNLDVRMFAGARGNSYLPGHRPIREGEHVEGDKVLNSQGQEVAAVYHRGGKDYALIPGLHTVRGEVVGQESSFPEGTALRLKFWDRTTRMFIEEGEQPFQKGYFGGAVKGIVDRSFQNIIRNAQGQEVGTREVIEISVLSITFLKVETGQKPDQVTQAEETQI